MGIEGFEGSSMAVVIRDSVTVNVGERERGRGGAEENVLGDVGERER